MFGGRRMHPVVLRRFLRVPAQLPTEVVREVLRDNPGFRKLAEREGALLRARDEEDEKKLAAGVQLAIQAGTLPCLDGCQLPEVVGITVDNRLPSEVAEAIISHLPNPALSTTGRLVTLQGKSGTGKGATAAALTAVLPRTVTWSNGDIFRCLTYLAISELGEGHDVLPTGLPREAVQRWLKRIDVVSHRDSISLTIDTGRDVHDVGSIANTVLKSTAISRNLPTVAQTCQGEVVRFTQSALHQLQQTGWNVIVEGRSPTLQFLDTPFRFELVLRDQSVAGARRAAQRILALLPHIPCDSPDFLCAASEVCLNLLREG